MRKYDFSDLIDHYFELNQNFNKRDDITVRKTVLGLIKLIYPNRKITKEEIAEILEYSIEGRRRVKEQLKKMVENEFNDTDLGYIDIQTDKQYIISLPNIEI